MQPTDWTFDSLSNPVIQHAVAACKPVVHYVTKNVPVNVPVPFTPWSFYMYAFIAAVATGAIAGVIGYFVGKRGLTGTQTDLKNAASEITKVTTEVKDAATTVTP